MALAWAFAKCPECSAASQAGWAATPNTPSAKSGNFMANFNLWRVAADRQRGDCHLRRGLRYEAVWCHAQPGAIGLATIGVLWICTVAHFGGARITGQLSSITVWGVIIPLSGCASSAGSGSVRPCTRTHEPAPCTVLSAVGSSIAATLWAFLVWNLFNAEVVENRKERRSFLAERWAQR